MTETTRDLIQRLADALHDAAEDVEGWGNYASSYFQEKHDLPGNIAKIHAQAEEARAYLAQPEPEGSMEKELIQRLLSLAEQAVKEALAGHGGFVQKLKAQLEDLEFEDPEDRYIWRELQELKQLAEKVVA